MPQPKVYGSPTGYQPPDPKRVQKKPTPPTDTQVHAAYSAHMQRAHQQFQQQFKRPRGASGSTSSRQTSNPRIDAEVDKASR